MAKKVHIVGAGFSGLTAAYYLHQEGYTVCVHEKKKDVGGLIRTEATDYGLVEFAANAILRSDLVEKLASDLKIKLIATNPDSRKRYIFRAKPKRWPLDFLESTNLITRLGLNLLKGTFRPGIHSSETVTMWGRRVLGDGATKNLLSPALAGVYAGDLSRMDASLVIGAILDRRKSAKQKGYGGSVAPEGGMREWIHSLMDHLEAEGVEINLGSAFDWSKAAADEFIVLANGLVGARDLVREKNPRVAEKMDTIEALSLVSVTCFFPPSESDIRGFGCLFSPEENANFLGVLFNSDIFEKRSNSYRSETWIGGGAKNENLIELGDRELLNFLRQDRERIGQGWTEPKSVHIQRWPNRLPHFTAELRRFIESDAQAELAKQNIILHGNYTGAIGLASILDRSFDLPEKLRVGVERVE